MAVRVKLFVAEWEMDKGSEVREVESFVVPDDTDFQVDASGQILALAAGDGIPGNPKLAFVSLKEFPLVTCGDEKDD